MEPTFTPDQQRFRAELRGLLALPQVADELAAIAAVPQQDRHPEGVYRLLGEHAMLAPDWPERYGGRGLPATYTAIVQEELTAHDVPDTVFINTIKNAGALLLFAADREQKMRHLLPLARGEASIAVLYTESEAGSDLASLCTRADRVAGGWRITGVKRYSVKTAHAAHGVIAARTESGITLFLVPLAAEGVEVRRLETLNAEPFYEVVFDGVFAADADVLGPVGGGWFVLSAGLAIERTGIDYNAKAARWLDLAAERVNAAGDEPVLVDRLTDLRTQVAAGRLLAWRLMERLDDGDLPSEEAAMSKWFNGELGARAARLCLDACGAAGALEGGVPAALLREAPGLTLSAGTSEIMLQIAASGLCLGGVR
ncbi:acyl-CoA dehydrogenase [Kibdelosporangium aridum]|uniref:Acyl-CoA dehydrogenase n=1 Tax=Kibdelosporangium aridum TaxID=2030 RepID=A0A428ZD07_KIBAR|nr:acyl-CoA dehydrogenase family protein [Kibdelosporangium aridum]RSM85954.1 acyl-CoA dehydrogenase [Kibdelosporangium aridum]